MVREALADPEIKLPDDAPATLIEWKRKRTFQKGLANRGLRAAAQERSRQKAKQAADLRLLGVPWRQIAEQLGYTSSSAAYKAYQKLVKQEAIESVSDVVKMQAERLDMLFSRLWDNGAKRGNPRHVEVAVKLMDRQARLLGLDAEIREKGGSSDVNINITYAPAADITDAERANALDAEYVAIEEGRDSAIQAPETRALQSGSTHESAAGTSSSDSDGGGDGSGEDVVRPELGS